MIEWTGGANFISNGEYTNLSPGYMDIEKKEDDRFAVSFVSDINNRFVAFLNRAECEKLSDKLKDITKKDKGDY